MLVAHHIPGRIRVRIAPRVLADREVLKILKAAAASNGNLFQGPAIISARMNATAGSMVIEYDSDLIAPEILEEFFATQNPARIEKLFCDLDKHLSLSGIHNDRQAKNAGA